MLDSVEQYSCFCRDKQILYTDKSHVHMCPYTGEFLKRKHQVIGSAGRKLVLTVVPLSINKQSHWWN